MGESLPVVDLGTERTAVQVACGQSHTCALLDDSSVKCWGYNAYGQLGQGDITQRGDGTTEMGDSLPAIDLGTGRTAVQVACGDHYTCALLDDSSVKCWGYNGEGQLGQGDATQRGDDTSEMGDSLPAIGLGTGRTAIDISASKYGMCALLDDYSVKCWGYNSEGQLGQGDTTQRGDGTSEMGDYLPELDLGKCGCFRSAFVCSFHAMCIEGVKKLSQRV
jgi:alpha-tubulin suppressor-like RCC1 family protein